MEDFEYDQRRAIRAWTVNRVSVILDNNDSCVRYRLQGAARDGVLHGMGTGYGRDDYEKAVRRGEADEYARVVGIYVVDELQEWLGEQEMPEIIRTLLMDLLDLGDSAQRDLIGEHYLPDIDDVEWDEDE